MHRQAIARGASTEQMISGANPITCLGKDGKQYVAVAAGTTLLTYTLP